MSREGVRQLYREALKNQGHVEKQLDASSCGDTFTVTRDSLEGLAGCYGLIVEILEVALENDGHAQLFEPEETS